MQHPERDPLWQQHASSLLRYVRTAFGKGPFSRAWGIDEQRAPGRRGCCSPVGLGSTTSRWAVANAALFARAGDETAHELALRSLNYATYFAARNGLISCCGKRAHNTYWFSDGYADYLRNFNWAMALLPEAAPKHQNHLLGSDGVVQAVTYGRRRLSYRTFAASGTEVARLAYRPRRVVAGAVLEQRADLAGEGYVIQPVDGGDYVIRIRHEHSRQIRIEG